MSTNLSYRPDIDGLRAIAVLGVVFFHAGFGFPGGYVGVDVFFVISGFLITSLLLKDLQKGTFSILTFWERRARRILPALAVMILFTLTAGYFVLTPVDYTTLGKSVLSIVALSSNIQFWRETDYFSTAAEENPLLHTWSLSLEEQFYLVTPLAMALLFRWGKSRWIFWSLVGLCGISFIISCYGAIHYATATFYLLPTRTWELGFGSLLAFATAVKSAKIRGLMSTAGLLGIALPFALYDSKIAFPGLAALPPVAGASLLMWAGMGQSGENPPPLVQRLLGSAPMVWIGLLSYSLYLWHWPLLAFNRYLGLWHDSPTVLAMLVLVGFIIAWLSLRFVERPFRNKNFLKTRAAVFGWSAAVIMMLVIPATTLWRSRGFPARLNERESRVIAAESDHSHREGVIPGKIPDVLKKFGAPGAAPGVFVWGDSHAMALLSVIDDVCKNKGMGGLAAVSHITAPVFDWYLDHEFGLGKAAIDHHKRILEYLQSETTRGQIKFVVLAGMWEPYAGPAETRDSFSRSLGNTIQRLQDLGYQVILVEDTATWPMSVPRAKFFSERLGVPAFELSQPLERHKQRNRNSMEIIKVMKTRFPQMRTIDPIACFLSPDGIIQTTDEKGVFYFDHNHLSNYGASRLKPLFEVALD